MPQGTILSIFLFSIFVNDITEVIDIHDHLYADDMQLYYSAPITILFHYVTE